MLDLAIEMDTDSRNTSIIETNHGVQLKAPDWPHDCEFQLVAAYSGDADHQFRFDGDHYSE